MSELSEHCQICDTDHPITINPFNINYDLSQAQPTQTQLFILAEKLNEIIDIINKEVNKDA